MSVCILKFRSLISAGAELRLCGSLDATVPLSAMVLPIWSMDSRKPVIVDDLIEVIGRLSRQGLFDQGSADEVFQLREFSQYLSGGRYHRRHAGP